MKGLINYWLPVIVWMGGIYWDEWHQSLVPNREARLLDVSIDIVGMVMTLGLIWWRPVLK